MSHPLDLYVELSREIEEAWVKSIQEGLQHPPKNEEASEKPQELLPFVVIYTDGSWKHKIEAGAWCALLTYKDQWKLVSESVYNTTINRMELSAVIRALKCLKTKCRVLVISDSQLTVNTINFFIKIWLKNNFRTSKGTEIANRDLVEELISLMKKHVVTAKWIKAHTGAKDINSRANAICDYFAQKEADRLARCHKHLSQDPPLSTFKQGDNNHDHYEHNNPSHGRKAHPGRKHCRRC